MVESLEIANIYMKMDGKAQPFHKQKWVEANIMLSSNECTGVQNPHCYMRDSLCMFVQYQEYCTAPEQGSGRGW